MQADGFKVGSAQPVNLGGIYHYIAWKATPGRMAVGSYSGNNAAGRAIDSAGFRPEWVLVKYGVTNPWVTKAVSSQPYTDYSLNFSASSAVTNRITALRPKGFEVGTDAEVNSSGGSVYHWVAFGPSTARLPFLVKSGSYVGNLTGSRPIEIGFQPDVVIIDNAGGGTSSDRAMIATSTMAGKAKEVEDTTIAAGTGIITLTSSGMTVGAATEVNGSGSTLHYVAFTAAAGSLAVGSYTGNGSAQTISGVGFQPVYVVVIPEGETAPAAVHGGDGVAQLQPELLPFGHPRNRQRRLPGRQRRPANELEQKTTGLPGAAAPGQAWVGTYAGNGAIPERRPDRLPARVGDRRVETSRRMRHGTSQRPPASTRRLRSGSRSGARKPTRSSRSPGAASTSPATAASTPPRARWAAVPRVPTYYWAAFGPHTPNTNYRSIGTATYGTGVATVDVTAGSTTVVNVGELSAGDDVADLESREGDVITIPCGTAPRARAEATTSSPR